MRKRPRVLLALSTHGHCLTDLLHRWSSGALPAEVVGVISNHEAMRVISEWYGLDFHYLPVTPGTKVQHVTTDHDEGPIIEQAVERIDHNFDIRRTVADWSGCRVRSLRTRREMALRTPDYCQRQ